MDKFIVSARKYRPQTFDTVVGQSHITTTLRNAIKNQQLAINARVVLRLTTALR
jgi:DNA polymerase III subunit gamma/tau